LASVDNAQILSKAIGKGANRGRKPPGNPAIENSSG
jgi:hypothetical protein